ncbi:PiggyBac transposable element-derived protein 4 [Blattella germanica]|nr:PiggyBac transposable element-derived protein 4 [Blattella germanica]
MPDNDTQGTFSGPKKLFKIHTLLNCLNLKFQNNYIPCQNIAIDKNLTLKSCKYGIDIFGLCESSSGYLWKFIIYTGSETDVESKVNCRYVETNKASDIVIKLMEDLLNKGYNLWMDDYYNSPNLAAFLKTRGTHVAGTLRLNRKNVPPEVKCAKLRRGEFIAQHLDGVMVLKWKDRKEVAIISTFHDAAMATQQRHGVEIKKPACVVAYNHTKGAVDLQAQKLQAYLLERKRGTNWYMKLFRRLLNVSVHNALVFHNSQNSKMDHLNFRVNLVTSLFERYGSTLEIRKQGRPSINPPPTRLRERHFIEKIPATGKKAKPQKRCVVCQKKGKRKESIYSCPDCKAGLCLETCFKVFHTVEDL